MVKYAVYLLKEISLTSLYCDDDALRAEFIRRLVYQIRIFYRGGVEAYFVAADV